mgnify:CR=1 FL=1
MKVIRRCRDLLLGLILVFMCLLVISERWFLDTWDSEVGFSTVVYQLFSPLKGTGGEVMHSYIENCVYPALLIVAACASVYAALCIIAKRRKRKVKCVWEVIVSGKRKVFSVDAGKLLSWALVFLAVCGLGSHAWLQAVEMGAID